MGADDDPFGLSDTERTQVLRPQPGGRGPGTARAPDSGLRAPDPLRGAGRAATGTPLPEGTPGRGPLVEAAHGILLLAPRLGARTPPVAPAELRARLEAELTRYTDRAHAKNVDSRLVQLGHYSLCALIDDIVLNTPWGAHGAWKSESLVGTLHHDVAAGERFFEILDSVRREPQRNRPLLELMAASLAMGFEGRYRLQPGGAAQIARIREEVLAQLAQLDGPPERELSGTWQGAGGRHVALSERVPLWVAGSAALLLLAIVYTLFAFRIAGFSERLGPIVAGLPPAGPVQLIRQALAQPQAQPQPQPRPAPVRIVSTVGDRLRACLRNNGASEDQLSETVQRLRIRLPNAGLFGSGSADLNSNITPLLGCIGRELAPEPGRILVVGHSDNIPIRTSRFPSNYELSKARAEAVQRVLAASIGNPQRIGVEGLADTDPIVPNTDEAGRSRNRRVEILLLR